MARKGGNPQTYFKPTAPEPVAKLPVTVKLPIVLDEYVRSLPKRAEWLRQAIAAQVERDLQAQQEDCT